VPRQILYDEDRRAGWSARRFVRGVRGVLFFVSLVAAILYGAALILATTDGVRAQLAAALSSRLGIRVAVRATSLRPPFTLVARHVVSTGATERAGLRFRADEVRFVWGWPRRGQPALQRIELVGGGATWRPEVTGAVATGDWARIEQVLSLAFGTTPPAPDAELPVALRWRAERFEAVGTAPASAFTAEIAEVRWTPLRIEDRSIVHLYSSARTWLGGGATSPVPWELEVILAGARRLDLRAPTGSCGP